MCKSKLSPFSFIHQHIPKVKLQDRHNMKQHANNLIIGSLFAAISTKLRQKQVTVVLSPSANHNDWFFCWVKVFLLTAEGWARRRRKWVRQIRNKNQTYMRIFKIKRNPRSYQWMRGDSAILWVVSLAVKTHNNNNNNNARNFFYLVRKIYRFNTNIST